VTAPPRILLGACLSLVLCACGVRFTASEGNEFFTSIDVSGDMRAGATLTGAVSFDQTYPSPVSVRCEIRQSGELVSVAGEAAAPAHPAGRPDATPFPGNFAFDFHVDEPGTYIFQCYTPRDEENFIEEEFHIAPGDETPVPAPPTVDPTSAQPS
jgi:hypothetical protein